MKAESWDLTLTANKILKRYNKLILKRQVIDKRDCTKEGRFVT